MRWTIAWLWVVACALRAAAPTAVVSGKVVDENGVAVAGARIQIRRVPEGLLAVNSEPGGGFRLTLEAGDCELRVEKTGFFLFQEPRLALHPGDNPLTVTLNHLQDLADSVNVTYAPPVIDPKQTTETKALTNVEILQIPFPAAQDIRRALPLLPGVVLDAAGRGHVNGGAENQTSYTLNGFNLADPYSGRLEARLNIDAVQTVELKSSRFAADTGQGSAGAVELKTDMGDDHWRFAATNFFPGLDSQQGLHVNKWTPRLKFSGPLRKGRVWFDNAFESFYRVDTVSGALRPNQTSGLALSNLARVQVNVTSSNILTSSLLVNYGDDRRHGLSFLDPVETTVNQRFHLFHGSLHDLQFFHNGGLLETGLAESHGFFRSSPQGTRPFVITPFGYRGNYFADQTRYTRRAQGFVNYSFRKFQAFGGHQLKIGADVERVHLDQVTQRHEYDLVRADRSALRSVRFSGNPALAKDDTNAAAYLIDRWSPAEALLVEAGIRSDQDKALGRGLLSPRLSAAYAPRWLRGVKAAAGYGIFYDAVTLEVLSRPSDQGTFSQFFAPTGAVSSVLATSFRMPAHGLRFPRHQALSFSLERELLFGIYGKAGYVLRRGTRQLGFTRVPGADDHLYYLLQNSGRDRYQAFELALRRTFAQRFEWSASYTRSSARSNAVVDYAVDSPLLGPQAAGPYSWDTPHRVLLWGWAPVPVRGLPHVLQRLVGESYLAGLGEYHTGFPFSSVDEFGRLAGAPNSRRFPAYYDLNLHLERRFHVMQYLWAWRVGVNNVTNSLNSNLVNNNINSPQFLAFGRGQARAVAVRLRFLGKK